MPPHRETSLFRLLDDLRRMTADAADVETAIRTWLRATLQAFDAQRACVAVVDPGGGGAPVLRHAIPSAGAWDLGLFAAVLRNERSEPPDDLILGPVHRRGRLWGVLALTRDGAPFARGDGRDLARFTQALSDLIRAIDDARVRAVEERIARGVLERRRPKDVFYRILHGLRSLTRYDHSSALLILDHQRGLELVAEQAAWTKTKSPLIGLLLPLDDGVGDLLARRRVLTFEREADGWRSPDATEGGSLARTLAFHDDEHGTPPEQIVLAAPLVFRGEVLGVLKVSARSRTRLGRYEAELLRRFQLLAAAAIANSRETETLRRDVLRAERKHAMANLARGISHDVNNALGAILPTLEQLRCELEDGTANVATALRDLEHVERAMHTCRRVFGGLLEFARNRERPGAHGDLRRALDNTLAILEGSMLRGGIELELGVPAALPPVRGAQHELEQLLLNLSTNACEAMPTGGRLRITVEERADHVLVEVADDGTGMDAEHLRRCAEAFFTTKPTGTGLGLSICHSIVQDVRGRIAIDSAPRRGTRVRVELPSTRRPVGEEVAT